FFEQAHGGTLFLDEIGDMDLTAQAKVLRALQNGEIVRVGSEHVIHVDVRVLAATNKELGKEVSAGAFREDLLFRLNVFPIRCPALRERSEDIPLLADTFVAAFSNENGLKAKSLDQSVYDALMRRPWPGNVRELKNVIERAAILAGDTITVADLPEDPHTSPFDEETDDAPPSVPPHPSTGTERLTLREYRESSERSYIVDTLKELEWNISKAAVVLGVERTNLHKKIRAYGIKRGEG
ncbi:MAG TPA: sigma 54-interacting transcriptional regulator, partial [Polyangiaceae bacterium]|nr:sigma 54-interacting transcriptional regulator [Polyangiaceae bacterium]